MKIYASIAFALSCLALTLSASAQDTEKTAEDTPPGGFPPPVVTMTQTRPGEKEKNLHAKEWERKLQQLARKEKAVLFCDVDASTAPPLMSYGDKPRGGKAMQALARALDYEWQEMNGIPAIYRSQKPKGDDIPAVSNWFLSLDTATRKRIAAGNFRTSELAPSAKPLLMKIACWDPDMSSVLLDYDDDVRIRVYMNAAIEYTDAATGQTRRQVISTDSNSDLPEDTTAGNDAKTGIVLEPLGTPPTGPLDFGRGSVLTLAEIVNAAEGAFAVHYHLDQRIAQSRYFINGKMNQDAFETVLERVTTIPPVQIRKTRATEHETAGKIVAFLGSLQEKIDVTGLRRSLPLSSSRERDALNDRFGAREELDVQDLLNHKSMSVNDLSKTGPGMAAFLASLNLPGGTMVRFTAVPAMVIGTQGLHPSSYSSSMVDGNVVPGLSPNVSRISLQ